jgi:hypothetical protein
VQTLAIATKTAFFAEMKFDMVAIPLRHCERRLKPCRASQSVNCESNRHGGF